MNLFEELIVPDNIINATPEVNVESIDDSGNIRSVYVVRRGLLELTKDSAQDVSLVESIAKRDIALKNYNKLATVFTTAMVAECVSLTVLSGSFLYQLMQTTYNQELAFIFNKIDIFLLTTGAFTVSVILTSLALMSHYKNIAYEKQNEIRDNVNIPTRRFKRNSNVLE